jgi:hypothetical protein
MTTGMSALYVGLKAGNRNYLLHRGYVRALKRAGWNTTWLSHHEGRSQNLESFDFILWDGVIPEEQLRKLRPRQQLVLLGGIGDELAHYSRYPEAISLLTSSHWYLDEPWSNLTRQHARWNGVRTGQVYYIAKYSRRFARNASPSTWKALGIKFLYLPFASDPEVFYPLKKTKNLRWGFAGNSRGRLFLRKLMAESDKKGWSYKVHAPRLTTQIDPLDLNEFYARLAFGVNEQHLMTFGRELNQRSFDLGMSGLMQLTDVGALASLTFPDWCTCYSAKLASGKEMSAGLQLAGRMDVADPDEVHTYFREHHSFDVRLLQIGQAAGIDFHKKGVSNYDSAAAAFV